MLTVQHRITMNEANTERQYKDFIFDVNKMTVFRWQPLPFFHIWVIRSETPSTPPAFPDPLFQVTGRNLDHRTAPHSLYPMIIRKTLSKPSPFVPVSLQTQLESFSLGESTSCLLCE